MNTKGPDRSSGIGGAWRPLPIFISSTFRDMQAERDYLRAHIFPQVEAMLRERRRHLESIDLRWGVDTASVASDEAREMLVLKVCLAEVKRSRPFMIGLLGDRYGWVPPAQRIDAAAREAGFAGEVAGKSVTALEIEYGILADVEQKRRCLFYFREPLPYDEMDAGNAADYSDAKRGTPDGEQDHAKLQALKRTIEKTLPGKVGRYRAGWEPQRNIVAGLEAFGKQVLEDLLREIDAETVADARAERSSPQAEDQNNGVRSGPKQWGQVLPFA